MKHLLILVFLCTALPPCIVRGQCVSSQKCPDWIENSSIPLQNSYLQVISHSVATEDEARDKALNFVITGQDLSTGGRYKTEKTD